MKLPTPERPWRADAPSRAASVAGTLPSPDPSEAFQGDGPRTSRRLSVRQSGCELLGDPGSFPQLEAPVEEVDPGRPRAVDGSSARITTRAVFGRRRQNTRLSSPRSGL